MSDLCAMECPKRLATIIFRKKKFLLKVKFLISYYINQYSQYVLYRYIDWYREIVVCTDLNTNHTIQFLGYCTKCTYQIKIFIGRSRHLYLSFTVCHSVLSLERLHLSHKVTYFSHVSLSSKVMSLPSMIASLPLAKSHFRTWKKGSRF